MPPRRSRRENWQPTQEPSWMPARENCMSIRATPRVGKACIPTILVAHSRPSRPSVPGIPVGLSTGWWIAPQGRARQQQIRAWQTLPDYVSVNLIEEDAAEIIDLALQKGIGVEAGLSSAPPMPNDLFPLRGRANASEF